MNASLLPYGKLCTEFYDLDKPQAPPETLSYYISLAKNCQGPILEPMCGSGRFLIPMIEEGLPISGFDSSPSMIAACREKCRTRGLVPDIQKAGFDKVVFEDMYGLIFIPSGSFGLLIEEEEVRQALQTIHNHLRDDGKFVFEIETKAAIREPQGVWLCDWLDKGDGAKLLLSNVSRFDKATSVETVLCRYECWQEGRIIDTEVEEFRLRLYEAEEIERLLKQMGFTVNQRLVPHALKEVSTSESTLLYECVKKRD